MHSCDESLFLALNFDGGPCLDRIMTLISGMAIWIPFYLLILWLVCRRYGWRNTLLFLAALALALVLSDMLCGIFKHSGPLKHLWADFPPRWRPMFSPALEGLDIPADSLFAWRHAGLPTPNSLVHVPAGVHDGHVDIRYDNIGLKVLPHFQSFLAVYGSFHLISSDDIFEATFLHIGEVFIILYQEQFSICHNLFSF